MTTGISNRLPAEVEVQQNKEAIENFAERIIETGRVPGTHTLGAEFKTYNQQSADGLALLAQRINEIKNGESIL